MPALLQALLHELPQAFSERVHLLSLELRRVRNTLAVIVALVLSALLLLGTAWVALWVGVATALIQAGMSSLAVSALILLINAAAAAIAIGYARSRLGFLALPATMRQLTVSGARDPQSALQRDTP